MEQIPPFTSVMVLPETVQTKGVADVKLTGRLELAVALIEMGVVDKVTFGKAEKLML